MNWLLSCVTDGSNVPLYAAAVGGGVGFLAIVIVVGCCIKRKRNTGEFTL